MFPKFVKLKGKSVGEVLCKLWSFVLTIVFLMTMAENVLWFSLFQSVPEEFQSAASPKSLLKLAFALTCL